MNTTEDLTAHVIELREVIRWMMALIEGNEPMPKVADDIYEAMDLCVTNTKDISNVDLP